jgi:hypothetical protein
MEEYSLLQESEIYTLLSYRGCAIIAMCLLCTSQMREGLMTYSVRDKTRTDGSNYLLGWTSLFFLTLSKFPVDTAESNTSLYDTELHSGNGVHIATRVNAQFEGNSNTLAKSFWGEGYLTIYSEYVHYSS